MLDEDDGVPSQEEMQAFHSQEIGVRPFLFCCEDKGVGFRAVGL